MTEPEDQPRRERLFVVNWWAVVFVLLVLTALLWQAWQERG